MKLSFALYFVAQMWEMLINVHDKGSPKGKIIVVNSFDSNIIEANIILK